MNDVVETKPKTMAELASEARDIIGRIELAEGELSAELELELAQNEKALAIKTDKYYFMIERIEHETKFWKEQQDMIKSKISALSNVSEYLKTNLKNRMIELGMKEMNGAYSRFALKPTSARLTIFDEKLIEAKYLKQVVIQEIDKDQLKKDLTEGAASNGARLDGGFALTKTLKKD